MNFLKSDIKRECGYGNYERGLQYYNSGRLENIIVEEESDTQLRFASEVQGSHHSFYEQIVIVKYMNSNKYDISGFCDCPVSYNCKHVVTACFGYLEQFNHGVDDKQKPSYWLDSLQSDNREVPSEKRVKESNEEYFITYRFFPKGRSRGGEIEIYKSKILKNGTIGKGTILDSYKFIHSYSYNEIKKSADRDIAPLYEAAMQNYSVTLKGALGYVLVQEIIKTGRAFFGDSKEPLTFDTTPFKSEYEMKLYKKEYTLKSNIDTKRYRVLTTKPALILDTQNSKLQELDIPLERYQKLLEAPKFQEEEIIKVFQAITTSMPEIELKTPKALKVKRVAVEPIAHLHIGKNSFYLDFDYDGESVDFYPQKSVKSFYTEDEKVEIVRNLAFEESAKERIAGYGFEYDSSDKRLSVSLRSEGRQEQLQVWKRFLSEGVSALESEGYLIEYDADFDMKFDSNAEVVVASDEVNSWFNLSFNLEFEGSVIPIAPLVTGIINEFDNFDNMPEYINIEINPNHFVEIKSTQIAPIVKTIIELLDKKDGDENLKISAYDAHLLEFNDDDIIWKGNREILELSKKLKDFSGIEQVSPSSCLNATLRDYQLDGLNWLNFLHEFQFGGILADDMGLGKTIQTLAHLSRLKEQEKLALPSLIIMPTSLIANWKNEAKKFTPNLSLLSLHGSDRAERFKHLEEKKYDILLTTYQLALRDEERFEKMKFEYIILDEAQKIKNPKAKMSVAIKGFQANHRLALSGTPIENHLGELWSIYSFLMPGFLDTLSAFKTIFQNPIEKDHDMQRQSLLNKKMKPFMLRRTKELVVKELPTKSEIIKYTQFDTKQSKLYESIRVTMEQKVRDAVDAKGLASSHITILDALLKLRQVCCDPSLLKLEAAQKLNESAKLTLLLDLLDELLAEGRKILLFSQFTSMLSIIEKAIKLRKMNYTKLTGSTRKREEAIEAFTKGDADIFLISLKAGGVGLNLVEADTVIHYDPWWNPAVENQATDRAHRIGQKKAVFVYKLIVENSIEQKILELQEKKKVLQENIYNEDGQNDELKFDGNELLELLK